MAETKPFHSPIVEPSFQQAVRLAAEIEGAGLGPGELGVPYLHPSLVMAALSMLDESQVDKLYWILSIFTSPHDQAMLTSAYLMREFGVERLKTEWQRIQPCNGETR